MHNPLITPPSKLDRAKRIRDAIAVILQETQAAQIEELNRVQKLLEITNDEVHEVYQQLEVSSIFEVGNQ